MSGSGKSTIAHGTKNKLKDLPIYILDGDELRRGLNSDLGYSLADRKENIRRAGWVAKIILDCGVIPLCTFISPTEEMRKIAESIVSTEKFRLVYVKASLDTCMSRDPKGLYARAVSGQVSDFTGIHQVFEEPSSPHLIIDTEKLSISESIDLLCNFILKEVGM